MLIFNLAIVAVFASVAVAAPSTFGQVPHGGVKADFDDVKQADFKENIRTDEAKKAYFLAELPSAVGQLSHDQPRAFDQDDLLNEIAQIIEDVAKSPTEDVAKSLTEDLAKSQTEDVAKSQTEDVAKSLTEDVAQSQTEDVAESQTVDTSIAYYMGVGYDLIKGNPDGDDFTTGGVDPGLRLRYIFKLTDNSGTTLSPVSGVWPIQVGYSPPVHACSSVNEVNAFSGSKSYQSKLDVSVDAEGMADSLMLRLARNHARPLPICTLIPPTCREGEWVWRYRARVR